MNIETEMEIRADNKNGTRDSENIIAIIDVSKSAIEIIIRILLNTLKTIPPFIIPRIL